MNARRLSDDLVRGPAFGVRPSRVIPRWLEGTAPDGFGVLLRRGVAAVAGGGLLVIGIVLLVRLASGALTPPTPAIVLLAGLATCALLGVTDAAASPSGWWLAAVAGRVGLIVTVGALVAAPRHAGAADWAARGIVLAATLAALIGKRTRPASATPRGALVRSAHARERPGSDAGRHAGARRPPGALRQRLERYERVDGTDFLRGTIVVQIPAGAKSGHGHVGFCPSFAALPTVQVSTPYDGVDATVNAAEVLPWGVRIECRLADPAEERVEIPVTVSASLAPTPIALP
ncbi:MAG TPA: hypothetical protein DC048_03495 [Planctomycetaceae bacterium]|nr:hypothetical protein [Planctomycetaceae bacterium]